MHVGKVLGRIFRDSSEIAIDRYKVRKETRKQYRPPNQGGEKKSEQITMRREKSVFGRRTV
jgi:hypothetical protein